MTYTVKWLGRYSEECATLDKANRVADMIVATSGNWTPVQRKLHAQVVITNEVGSEVGSRSVADEMARLRAQGTPVEESK